MPGGHAGVAYALSGCCAPSRGTRGVGRSTFRWTFSPAWRRPGRRRQRAWRAGSAQRLGDLRAARRHLRAGPDLARSVPSEAAAGIPAGAVVEPCAMARRSRGHGPSGYAPFRTMVDLPQWRRAWISRGAASESAGAVERSIRPPLAPRRRRASAEIRRARSVRARFLASAFAAPRNRFPSSAFGVRPSGGNRPKLTFIGWNERGPSSMVSIWPPVMWLMSAPSAVVAGSGRIPVRALGGCEAAGQRPTAALST